MVDFAILDSKVLFDAAIVLDEIISLEHNGVIAMITPDLPAVRLIPFAHICGRCNNQLYDISTRPKCLAIYSRVCLRLCLL